MNISSAFPAYRCIAFINVNLLKAALKSSRVKECCLNLIVNSVFHIYCAVLKAVFIY